MFVRLIVVSSFAITFVGAPIAIAVSDFRLEFGGVIPKVDTVSEGLVLATINLFAPLAKLHLVNLVSTLHAARARLMPTSKAKTSPTILGSRPIPKRPERRAG